MISVDPRRKEEEDYEGILIEGDQEDRRENGGLERGRKIKKERSRHPGDIRET